MTGTSVTESTAGFPTIGYFSKYMEAILTRFSKQVLSHLLVAGMLLPSAFAGTKESPHDTLVKSFQQGNLWTMGPVKLTANVRLPKPDHSGDITLQYTLSWAGPEKWRAEWTAGGFDQITVLNNGKLSYLSNQPKALVPTLQFETAVALLDGGNPAGPYTIPPLDIEKAKVEASKQKVNGVDAKCLTLSDPLDTYCIDAANGHILTVSTKTSTTSGSAEIGSFEYSDYTAVGDAGYPGTIKVNYAKQLLEEGKVTVSKSEKFDDKLFAAPDKSTSIDWPSCPDVSKKFAAPHLDKSVPPKVSDALKKAKKYGLVWVMVNVGKDGSVTKAILIAGDPDLEGPAIEAVKQYKYTPYTRCGQAVEFQNVVVVPFAPPGQTRPAEIPIEH
jgi:hypothetical protein